MSHPDNISTRSDRYIGLMSGTSLDGVDGVLADFSGDHPAVLADAYVPFPAELRQRFLDLQHAGHDEIHREALAANALAIVYAECVGRLLEGTGLTAHDVQAIGAHGQTIRHQPGAHDGIGYTRQTQHAAVLAERVGIDVIADFRSRDIAAGGQGAPLVPALHRALFGLPDAWRVVCNIGGIANLTVLPPQASNARDAVLGFDCGPGNALMDYWVHNHQGTRYDADGAWARTGRVDKALLARLKAEPFFAAAPPKSTGRDLFNPAWLQQSLGDALAAARPADVQATLLALTAGTIADAVQAHAPQATSLLVCGGGARNGALMAHIGQQLPGVQVAPTDDFGVPAHQVEALAFAWLARQCVHRVPGNLYTATGASGGRILGAIYPA
ncbi:anhydro-N-acetylmuramic acid kinase [Ralstonia mannitolilytica]|uniref:Anhydro-N-acetylmuramic acid kinase n=1 Tax=Ralstonia mannitolilytica TaxID=105219 RepID=A0AAJ5D3R1_9RALS|nr:anhydro-N-acetylmuramic acid kinase [Ralstonia mannitolilytica]CAG2142921.1 Anhydro-N-acetylmuramic acid kinase [Ralstonia mannitolilytica]CAJ0730400.1 Anhydro-N-acetylmuramic acid kinase [Ralstonia mannitolilytica]SUD86784.1 Anhydro-N-acetylmuramic acid kinase [Ralstonia mannitolilytica]SUD92722.1 Anhydro-N-acetylmuramic acid kinase [Ralstonia mannitolilytica]SUD96445.1 Anhydro-N-acetylmuramic acid kinase [Ralstonia mannitolilytica]